MILIKCYYKSSFKVGLVSHLGERQCAEAPTPTQTVEKNSTDQLLPKIFVQISQKLGTEEQEINFSEIVNTKKDTTERNIHKLGQTTRGRGLGLVPTC